MTSDAAPGPTLTMHSMHDGLGQPLRRETSGSPSYGDGHDRTAHEEDQRDATSVPGSPRASTSRGIHLRRNPTHTRSMSGMRRRSQQLGVSGAAISMLTAVSHNNLRKLIVSRNSIDDSRSSVDSGTLPADAQGHQDLPSATRTEGSPETPAEDASDALFSGPASARAHTSLASTSSMPEALRPWGSPLRASRLGLERKPAPEAIAEEAEDGDGGLSSTAGLSTDLFDPTRRMEARVSSRHGPAGASDDEDAPSAPPPALSAAWSGFRRYLSEELNPTTFKTADPNKGVTGWGLTERERVYYTLFRVPWEVERYVIFGWLMCCDSVVAAVTLTPLRVAVTVARLAWEVPAELMLAAVGAWGRGREGLEKGGAGESGGAGNKGDGAGEGGGGAGGGEGWRGAAMRWAQWAVAGVPAEERGVSEDGSGDGESSGRDAGWQALGRVWAAMSWVTADDVTDVLWMGIVVACSALLLWLNTGWIYHYIRSQEVLKLYVVMNTIEILDKILCSFSVDALQSMGLSTASMVSAVRAGKDVNVAVLSLASDALIAFGVCAMHSVLMLVMAITYSVAVNSTGNALFGLLIAIAFIEVKGTIFKKWDVNRLEKMTIQDIIERFTLSTCLLFVLLEHLLHMRRWVPTKDAAWSLFLIFVTEQTVDAVKHSFLAKFCSMKPGIYTEYTTDLVRKARRGNSHTFHSLLGFNPMALASLVIRITVIAIRDIRELIDEGEIAITRGRLLTWVVVGWLALLVAKVFLGALIRFISDAYLKLSAIKQERWRQARPTLQPEVAPKDHAAKKAD